MANSGPVSGPIRISRKTRFRVGNYVNRIPVRWRKDEFNRANSM
jgi:hypothetical protein